MAAPGRTFDAHLIVGTDRWIVDLDERRCVSLSVNGDASITQQAVLGVRAESALANSAGHMVDVGSAYVGVNTELLRAEFGDDSGMPWVCVFDEEIDLVYVMEGLLTGLPEAAPTNDAITTTFGFPQADRFFADGAGVARDFDFTSSDISEPVGDVADDSGIFVVVTQWSTTSATTVTVGDGTTDLTVTVRRPGIYFAGKANAAIASGTITIPAATFSSAETGAGYVLAAQEVDA